jgi:phosphatidylglycerol:prolipoprotein diacylglycerol transferase
MASLIYPNISPSFQIGPLTLRWYGLAYVAAFLAAWWILKILDERWGIGLGPEKRMVAVLAAVIGVIVGGRLGYVLFYSNGRFLTDPLWTFAINEGGMSFHGGLAGILLAGVWFSRRYKVPFLTLCDIGAVGAPVGLFLGRIANFINGELWGRVDANLPWGMVFPAPGAGPLPRHPSQLYEAGLEGLVIFIVMLVMARKRRAEGLLVGWMLTLYGIFRIFVEFFREPDIQIGFLAGIFTMGQLLSLPLVVVGIWLIVRATRAGAPHTA